MAHYVATVSSRLTPDEAFAYMADFRNVAEWDPSIKDVDLLDGAPAAEGGRYRVKMSSTELDYEMTDVEHGRRVVVRGENGWVVSIDEITVAPGDDGLADVTYDAKLSLKGPLKLGDPLLSLVFRRLGDQARDGLRERIGRATPAG